MAQENETEILLTINVDKAKRDLAALTQQIQELNAAGDDNEDEVRALEKQWDQLSSTIQKAEKAQQPLTKQLREIERRLQQLKLTNQENTEEYARLIAEAGKMKDAMLDTSSAINKTASDTANLDAALGALGAATGGFGIVTAGMSMFGGESEKAEKMQKKLMEAIALVNSVQQLSNALNKDSALMVKLHSVAQGLLSKQMQATATATATASTAMKGLRAALVSTGVGALVIALGFLVQKLIEHNEQAKEAQTDEEALKTSMDRLKESTDFLAESYDKLRTAKEKYAQTTFETATDAEKLDILNKSLQEQEINLKGAQEQIEAYQKQVEITGKDLAAARKQYDIFGNDFKQSYEEAQAAFNNAKANLKGSQAQVLEFNNAIGDIKKQRDDIIKNQAASSEKESISNKKYIAEEIQSRLNAAKAKTQILKQEFDAYSKAADAEISIAVEKRNEYGKALEEQIKIEKELLDNRNAQAIEQAEGNEIALKTAKRNFQTDLDAINRTSDVFKNNMDETADAVRMLFMKSEAEVQTYIDSIMTQIDEINARSQALRVETGAMQSGKRTMGTALTATDDPEYLAEKRKIQEQIESYRNLAESRVEFEAQANMAIEALRQQDMVLEANYAERRKVLWKDAIVQISQYVGSTLTSISQMQDTESKKGFENAKKLQYASTVVNTLAAMMGAYRSLVEIPVVGPALATAAMTAAAATGAVQLAAIKKQKFQDSGSISSSATNSSGRTSTGSSSVSSTIISRNISAAAMDSAPKTQPVLVVDDVTYKQQQQQNVSRVSTI